MPVDSTLAQNDPARFAGRLMERLLVVKRDSDQMECMKNSLRSIDVGRLFVNPTLKLL